MKAFFNAIKKLFTRPTYVAAPVITKPVVTEPPHVKATNETSFDVGSDIIPFAVQSIGRMKTTGKYKSGWPSGAVVHYTAGRNSKGSAQATINGGIKDGYAYLCIDGDGKPIQAHPVSRWGAHAGKSMWKGFLGGLNDDMIGIEVCCAGLLTEKNGNLYTWYGTKVERQDAFYVSKAMYPIYKCPVGYYQKYTIAQTETLKKVLVWLKRNDPSGKFSFDNVLGHHEVSGIAAGYASFRKSDPGGSIGMSMSEFRSKLKTLA